MVFDSVQIIYNVGLTKTALYGITHVWFAWVYSEFLMMQHRKYLGLQFRRYEFTNSFMYWCHRLYKFQLLAGNNRANTFDNGIFMWTIGVASCSMKNAQSLNSIVLDANWNVASYHTSVLSRNRYLAIMKSLNFLQLRLGNFHPYNVMSIELWVRVVGFSSLCAVYLRE